MSKITQGPAVAPHGLLNVSNNSNVAATPGSFFQTPDGRSLVYVLAGASDLPAGVLVQSPALVANDQGLGGTNQKIGDTTILLTTVGAIAAGYYSNGFLEVTSGTGAGQRLKITYNPVALASSTVLVTLEDPFFLAVDNTSVFNLVADAYSNVVINPTTETASPIGSTLCVIPAGEYGYIQKGGNATVLFDAVGSTTKGLDIKPSTTVAGAVTANITTTTVALSTSIGFAVNTTAASHYGTAYLQL